MEEEDLKKKENELVNTNGITNGNKNGIIAILLVIIVVLIGAVVYFMVIKKDDDSSNKNANSNSQNDNSQVVDNKNADIYGTYYNSFANGEYFKIDNDNTCIFVSTCGDTITKTVPYKVTRENDKIMLSIDINEDGTYLNTYTGLKNNGVYRFKPNSYGCTTDENTYFVKK